MAVLLTKKSLARRVYATILNAGTNTDGYKEQGGCGGGDHQTRARTQVKACFPVGGRGHVHTIPTSPSQQRREEPESWPCMEAGVLAQVCGLLASGLAEEFVSSLHSLGLQDLTHISTQA